MKRDTDPLKDECVEQRPVAGYFDGLPVSRAQVRMVVLIGLGIFFDIMENCNFGFVAPVLAKEWGLSLVEVGKIHSVFFAGMFLGGLLGGVVSDRFGRKVAIESSIVLFSLCSIGNGLASSFYPFLLARFLTGIGVASLVTVAPPYLSEMLPGECRGRWVAIAIGMGYLALPFVGAFCKLVLPLGPEAWRLVYLVGGLGLLSAGAARSWLRESPRWLVAQGRAKEAERVLTEVSGRAIELRARTPRREPALKGRKAVFSVFGRQHLRDTLVLLSIFAIALPSVFIFTSWAPLLWSTRGMPMAGVLSLSLFMSFGMAGGPFLAAGISDKGGRKIPLVVLCTAAAVLSAVYPFLEARVYVIGLAVLISLVLQAKLAVAFTYLPELYPTKVRSTAAGIVYSASRVSTALVHMAIPVLNAHFGPPGVFLLMPPLLLTAALVTGLWGVRTGRKSLESLHLSDALQARAPRTRRTAKMVAGSSGTLENGCKSGCGGCALCT